jgi:flap endonuclease-1
MGIKNLLKFLNSYPDLIVEKNIDDFKGKKIAIDISILLYQIIIYVRNTGSDLTNKKGEITSHILGLFNKTIKLLSKGIIPVYVFDGKPPQLKKKVLDIRKNIKQKSIEKMNTTTNKEDIIKYFKRSVTITKKQLDDCRQLLNLMGVQYIDAPEEADSQCAWLAKNGFVDAVFTEDMDILTFGSPYIIKNLTSIRKKPIEISLQKIKNKFEWTQDQFIDFCILLGCDYCDNFSNYNCFEIFKIFQKNKSIDLFLKNNNKTINYIDSKHYFKEPHVNTNITSIKLESVNFKELVNVLVNKHDLIKYKIIKKINQLIIYQAKIKCNTNMLFTFQCT